MFCVIGCRSHAHGVMVMEDGEDNVKITMEANLEIKDIFHLHKALDRLTQIDTLAIAIPNTFSFFFFF